MESQYMIKIKKMPVHYSVQATLDCMQFGCDGGLLPDPLRRMVSYGVTNYENDPYVDKVRKMH